MERSGACVPIYHINIIIYIVQNIGLSIFFPIMYSISYHLLVHFVNVSNFSLYVSQRWSVYNNHDYITFSIYID